MLYEIFNQMKKHTSLYGQTSFSCVSQYFGKDTIDRPSSYPSRDLMPSSDEYGSFQQQAPSLFMASVFSKKTFSAE